MVKRVLIFWLGLLWLPELIFAGEVIAPKNPNSAKGCAICHYRWVDTFFIQGRGSDLVPYQSEKNAANEEMCLSCHDGSVMDSREQLSSGRGHTVNRPPPAGMVIPKIFPLDENGNLNCGTCHTAHGVPSGDDPQETIFMRASNRNSAMCRMCHPREDGGNKQGNHPIDAMMPNMPRDLVVKNASVNAQGTQLTCQNCHVAHGSKQPDFLADSTGRSQLCLRCHGDKDAFGPDGRRRPGHMVNMTPDNIKVPGAIVSSGAKLGDRGVVICQTCHKVHRNNTEKQLLIIRKDEGSGLCLTCHTDKNTVKETKHDLRRSRPEEKNLQERTAVQDGVCSACHLPHRAAREPVGQADYTTQLCMSCHAKGRMAEKDFLIGGYTHPVDINPFEKTVNGTILRKVRAVKGELKLPLYNQHGIKDPNGVMTCATCHNPHDRRKGDEKELVPVAPKKVGTTPFLRENSPAICAECHRNKFDIAYTKHNLAKAAPEAKNILNQTVGESGLCGSCHLTHSAQRSFLWARPMSADSDGYLCSGCHRKDGMAAQKLPGSFSHPLGIKPAEKGLTTVLPLFDAQGKLAASGAMSCYTCHDPHHWDPGKESPDVSAAGEGSALNSFLRIPNAPTSHLCEACHKDQALVEKTDHDLGMIDPQFRNSMGRTAMEVGTCGICHLAHNAGNRQRLWALDFGEGEHIMDRMCYSCHATNGSAANKIPQISTHPREKIVNVGRERSGFPGYFPLFDHATGEKVTVENISCPSCHTVHQWSPSVLQKGPGRNVEGDATNSFLRARLEDMLCKDCHGDDALYRFKYYHKKSARLSAK